MVSRVLIALLFLIAVPAWGSQLCVTCHSAHYVGRGSCIDCHRGNPDSERKNIAHERIRAGKYVRFTLGEAALMKEGQRVIDLLACRRCHSSAGRGNSLTTNLDGAALRKTPKELVQSIRNPATNMPDFALTEEQMTVLINAIYSGSLARKPDQIAPVKVHFNSAGRKDPDIFSTKCGSCHRIISARLGAVGTGDIGPNLSGLFSGFYPKTFRNDEVWTTKNLDTWLKNPRVIRPWARMQPVLLNEIETREIESVIGSVSNNSASKEGR